MKTINLLPWRQKLRMEQTFFFTESLIFSLMIGASLAFIIYLYALDMTFDAKEAIEIIKSEISECDKKIVIINQYQKTKDALISRLKIVQSLQSTRALTVHLFDEMTNIIPDGIVITSMKRIGNILTIQGFSESNTNVSILMRNIENNPWFSHPMLTQVKRPGKEDKAPEAAGYSNEFELHFTLEPRQKTESEKDGASKSK